MHCRKVIKTGGSSISRPGDPENFVTLMQDDPERWVWTASAAGKRSEDDEKVTDILIAHAERDESAEPAIQRYAELFPKYDVGRFRRMLRNTRRRKYPSRQAMIDAYSTLGETWMGMCLADLAGLELVEAKEVIRVTEEYGSAEILPESADLLRDRINDPDKKYLLTGFQGITQSGHIAALGRGGTDTTGAFATKVLGAKQYEVWTDDVIRAAFPFPKNSHKIEEITYIEMGELSPVGFKIVHPDAVNTLKGEGVEMHVRDTRTPDKEGTLILDDRLLDPDRSVIGIAYYAPICIFNVYSPTLNRRKGSLGEILKIFYDRGHSVDHTPTGVNSISVVLQQEQLSGSAQFHRITSQLTRLVGRKGTVNSQQHGGYLVAAGMGLREDYRTIPSMLLELADQRIPYTFTAQGPDRLSAIIGVRQEHAELAAQVLYDRFVKTD
ncbi:hypothetical protein KY359_04370 [Candidatus Woesearchaeota archaeon]|nr:hypothetical protein [Candidatus Woesearchaeota archaeon]